MRKDKDPVAEDVKPESHMMRIRRTEVGEYYVNLSADVSDEAVNGAGDFWLIEFGHTSIGSLQLHERWSIEEASRAQGELVRIAKRLDAIRA